MKRFFGCLAGDLHRAFGSWLFWLAAVATCVACIIPQWDSYFSNLHYFGYFDFWEQNEIRSSGFYVFLFPVLGCLPFASAFCTDWGNRYIRSLCIRTGPEVYSSSKIIACFLSGAGASFLGQMLFLLMTVLFTGGRAVCLINTTPEEIAQSLGQYADYGGGFCPLLTGGTIGGAWLFMILNDFVQALYAGSMAALALTVSAFLPNIFVTLSSPVILVLLSEWIMIFLHAPYELYVEIVGNCKIGGAAVGGPATSLLYDIGYFITLTFLFGILFTHQIKRRLDRG